MRGCGQPRVTRATRAVRSAYCWHSAQRVAAGFANSRSRAISSPHSVQTPYSPSASRFSALSSFDKFFGLARDRGDVHVGGGVGGRVVVRFLAAIRQGGILVGDQAVTVQALLHFRADLGPTLLQRGGERLKIRLRQRRHHGSLSIAALPKLGGYEGCGGRRLTPVNGRDAAKGLFVADESDMLRFVALRHSRHDPCHDVSRVPASPPESRLNHESRRHPLPAPGACAAVHRGRRSEPPAGFVRPVRHEQRDVGRLLGRGVRGQPEAPDGRRPPLPALAPGLASEGRPCSRRDGGPPRARHRGRRGCARHSGDPRAVARPVRPGTGRAPDRAGGGAARAARQGAPARPELPGADAAGHRTQRQLGAHGRASGQHRARVAVRAR